MNDARRKEALRILDYYREAVAKGTAAEMGVHHTWDKANTRTTTITLILPDSLPFPDDGTVMR